MVQAMGLEAVAAQVVELEVVTVALANPLTAPPHSLCLWSILSGVAW